MILLFIILIARRGNYEIWDVVMYFLNEPLINIVMRKHYVRELYYDFTNAAAVVESQRRDHEKLAVHQK